MGEGSEGRYAHLLQPIKDLTKNWDVDISAYLEDYLEELEHTTISFDGGLTTMNFAEAAMMVQSSACVYSKKVEYLYSLVYQVMDMLANKKKQSQKGSVDDQGADADAEFNDDYEDDDFLPLDDLPQGKDTYMKEDFDSTEDFQLLPEIPLCLIPLEEGEKGANPLLSKKGEVLGSRNDFKMNTCCIHPQGTLLLDMSHLKLLQESLKMVTMTTQVGPLAMGTELRNIEEVSAENSLHTSMPGVDDHRDDSDHMITDEVDGGQPLADMSHHDDPMEEVVGQDGLRRSERNRERRPVPLVAKPYVDPWKPLDPHEETGTAKPATRRGKIHKPCPGIEEDKPKKRKRGKNAPEPVMTESLSKYLDKAVYSNAYKFPKNPCKVPTILGLDALYWQEYKRRQAMQRDLLKKKRESALAEQMPVEEEEEDIPPLTDVGDDIDDIEHLEGDNLINAIDNALASQPDSPDIGQSWIDRVEEGIVVTNYEDLVRQHVDEYMANAQEYAKITQLSRRVAEWEDKVIPRLEEEERHKEFDVNVYGESVINNLLSGSTLKFKELVRGKPIYEICRIFLTSLMLANTTNVRIDEHGVLEEGMDRFALELLSTKRHFEQLQEYTAPSLSQK